MKEKLTVVIECEGADSGTIHDIFKGILNADKDLDISKAIMTVEHRETKDVKDYDVLYMLEMVKEDL